MWKLPSDSEVLEKIDEEFKETLDDDSSDASTHAAPSIIAQVLIKTKKIHFSDRTLNIEFFDSKANEDDNKIFSERTIDKNNFSIGFICVIMLSITVAVAFVTIGTLSLIQSYTNNIAPKLSNIQRAIRKTISGSIDQNVYPSSYSIFAKNSDVIENPIPILFDITRGPGLSFLSRALSRCLNFKQISMRRDVSSIFI